MTRVLRGSRPLGTVAATLLLSVLLIKPGTLKTELFASLDWLPTFVDIAGGPKGNDLKAQIEAGRYPGIVKTTLDGVNQRAYLKGHVGEVGT